MRSIRNSPPYYIPHLLAEHHPALGHLKGLTHLGLWASPYKVRPQMSLTGLKHEAAIFDLTQDSSLYSFVLNIL
jgi:hypothetical protein